MKSAELDAASTRHVLLQEQERACTLISERDVALAEADRWREEATRHVTFCALLYACMHVNAPHLEQFKKVCQNVCMSGSMAWLGRVELCTS